MTSRTLALRLALTLLVVAIALPVLAQSAGNLRGTVTDETGNVVPGANVVLTSKSTSFTQKQASDARGGFYFAAITPGMYTVEASLAGFKTYKADNLRVGANDTLNIGVKLTVGDVVETISVTADQSMIQTNTGAREGLITPEQIESLSIMGRNPLELVRILPGVVAPDPSTTDLGQVGIGVGFGAVGNSFSINGARSENLGITMDGANLRDIGNNSGMLNVPNNEFVAEIKVQTSNYAAEYGSNITSVQAVTKSGSADFHGSLYWYGRPYQAQANDRSRNYANPNRDNAAQARPKSKFNYPGLTLSGPIIIPGTSFNKDKDKAFFFFGYELQKQQVDTGSILGVVPTMDMRDGNFATYMGGQNLDLGTTLNIPAGYANAGSPVPNLDFSPYISGSGQKLMKGLYPSPNYTDPNNRYNYITNRLNGNDRQQGVLRLDYNVSDNTRAYIRLARDKEAPERYRGLWWSPGGIETPTPLVQNAIGMSAVANVTSVLSPTTTNEVIFSWSRLKNDNTWKDEKLMTKANYGISDTVNPLTPTNPFVPELLNQWNGSKASIWFAQDVQDIFSYNGFFRVQDNLTKVLNTHALKFGVVVERQWKQQNFQHNANMQYDFDTWANGTSGNLIGDILAGRPAQVDMGEPSAVGMFVAWNLEGFAQDSWKVNKNLTLEYGLRFARWSVNTNTDGIGAIWQANRYNPSLPAYINSSRNAAWQASSGERPLFNGLAYAKLGDVPNKLTDNRPLLFMPRFNFAWDAKGDGDMIVRGGAGIFYAREQGNVQYNIINQPPNSFLMNIGTWSQPLGGLSYANVGKVDPWGSAVAPAQVATPNANDLAWPRAYNASISIAKRLPLKHTLEAGYVGTWQRHQVDQMQQNVLQLGDLYSKYSTDPVRLAALDASVYNSYKPYSTLGNVDLPVYVGFSNYNSAQVTLSRQSGNFTYLLAYTLSRSKGTTINDFAQIDPIGDWKTRDYGILASDRTHVMNASWTWRLGAPAKEGAMKFLLNDWNLSGISTWVSGQPFRPFFSGDISGDRMANAWWGTHDYEGGGGQSMPGDIAPTYSCNPNTGNKKVGENIWDVGCVGIPGFKETGPNYPPNTLRLPGKSFHDLTVFKDFGLGGSRRIQIRVGAFNIFNQAYADSQSFQDIDTALNTECSVKVSGISDGRSGGQTVDNICVPDLAGNFKFTSNTLSNFGKIITKRGHRSMEFAVRLFF